jgi:hypothetical protein
MGATGTNMNCGGDDTVAHALYDANDLLDSGGGTVSRGPVGDTMGTYGLGTPDDAIGMDGGGHDTDNAVVTFSEDHDEPDEGGMASWVTGSRLAKAVVMLRRLTRFSFSRSCITNPSHMVDSTPTWASNSSRRAQQVTFHPNTSLT